MGSKFGSQNNLLLHQPDSPKQNAERQKSGKDLSKKQGSSDSMTDSVFADFFDLSGAIPTVDQQRHNMILQRTFSLVRN